ncbi:class I SAM-dependent methyltransferase [Vineibacter terrae]|uniref:class I SAM-dependent methyltransferase n=1 Tax=Vineibacter terrae TaxID=2586908 RepID=UPI002E329153|nr:class I SAM-dependent methyltransferase [Vineibacter terrae]HEX2886171.1 class I SAM-dependent methyltransferase [Vineibacter terrae]
MGAEAAALLMDRMYRHQRHVYDASRKYYLLGRDHLIARLQPAPGATVLEIGSGTGRNLIAAARRYPHARFHGLDVSSAMLATARRNVARAGLSSRIRLVEADATTFDPAVCCGAARFDRVFISYSLSMIPAWRDVVDGVPRLLAPGGALHVVDFGDQARLPRWLRQGLRRWLALFDVTPCDDLPALLRAVAARSNLSVSVEPLYRGYARYAVMHSS